MQQYVVCVRACVRRAFSLNKLHLLTTEITGDNNDSGGTCIICIIIPIAILLAIILAIVVSVAVYAYYRWRSAPATDIKKKEADGING